MKHIFILLTGLLMTISSFGQTITEIYFPQYIQGAGTFSTADEKRVPFAYRVKISGLNPGATYRYYNRFVADPTQFGSGDGSWILVKSSGSFTRATSASFSNSSRYGEFTTDGTGSYEGWFIGEPSVATTFFPGTQLYARITLNDGNGGTSVTHSLTSSSYATVINFGDTESDGTGIRSTPAASGAAKNFVFLYDNTAGTGRPIAGTFIEADGTNNSASTFYADFYSTNVNEVDKTWGAIIPNNLQNGIQRIAQYTLADGTEAGFKTSPDGLWAKDGGGSASTVKVKGGITDVIVLDGNVVALGAPVLLPQTITFNPLPSKTYGDASFNPGATSSVNLPVSYSSSNPAVAGFEGNTLVIKGAGVTDITATQPGNNDYSAATPVTHTLVVNKALLTAKADDKTRLQGEANPVFTISYSGFVPDDDINDISMKPTATTPALQSSPPGTYPITPAGGDAANYQFKYEEGVLTVNAAQQPQVITFNALPAATYGAVDIQTTATTSSNLPLTYASSNPAVATIDNNGLIHLAGAGSATITVSQAGNSAFSPAVPVTQTLIVAPAALTITAENKTKLVGQPNPAMTAQYTGFVNNETPAVLTTQPVITTTATTGSPEGDYPISVNGATAANYTITFVNGILTIQPLPSQTITFDAFSTKRYGDADFNAGASASSGLTVSYTSSNPQVATITGEVIHILSAGSTDITASQSGDAFNAAATPVTRTLTIQKANLVITAADTSKREGQANPPLVLHYSGFVNGDDADDLATQPVATTMATTSSLTGNYSITVMGASSSNYNIAHVNGTLRILPPNGTGQDQVNAYLSGQGMLRINYYAVTAEKVNVQLFDSFGNRLLDAKLAAVKGTNTWHFDVGNLGMGIYPVRIAGKDTMVKTKVIIR